MHDDRESRIQHSWRVNADAWTRAVREQRIASRRAGTDTAIVETVASSGARRVADLGCGEGWLARALAARGCEVVGVDASPELIAAARELGGARFEATAYADLAAHELGRFDAVVFNFALLGDDLCTPLAAAHALLNDDGRLFVQTVHPWVACGDAPYADGWRLETFDAFGGEFREPMPWYFRTLQGWSDALRDAGFAIEAIVESVADGKPLSLLMRASARASDRDRQKRPAAISPSR